MQLYGALILFMTVYRIDGYNMVTKGCQTSLACIGAMACWEGNLRNSVIPTGPCGILLLVSSAIITLFL
ncbi:hypothetical protein EPR50_G00052600 [Perca flavescens]|uniref:Uncharacterized protein n=1 Tax=Perca flavescens TaxID=8167 RepID=A0A484DD37_PERFV|nr:hypothetical protein EPR50_G00052600 [Perca flavescens]